MSVSMYLGAIDVFREKKRYDWTVRLQRSAIFIVTTVYLMIIYIMCTVLYYCLKQQQQQQQHYHRCSTIEIVSLLTLPVVYTEYVR